MVDLSVLDLSPIVEGGDAAQSLRNTRDLAQNAERLGYKRYWLPSTTTCVCRQRGDLGGHRPRSGGYLHHPRRGRRHHAAVTMPR
jgi:alkanesulfonate monooxygenase SsuD/methylene tetrahydromethanopterin reductase-like flavin-dependent oxidoreductase (luciferase family)